MKCQFVNIRFVSCKIRRKTISPIRRSGSNERKCIEFRLPKRK